MPIIRDWLGQEQPDLLCLQETKVQDKDFPKGEFEAAGYQVIYKGQKAYNGVAIISKLPLNDIRLNLYEDKDQEQEARFISARINDIPVINVYVPQGFAPGTEKFDYKLRFLNDLLSHIREGYDSDHPLLLAGDLNVALEPVDLFDPEGLKGEVGFHPDEQAILREYLDWGFVDIFRKHHPEGGHYTFWDYRIPNGFTKLKAKNQPWQEAWEQLLDSSYAELSWKPRPVANVERGAYNRPDIGGTFFLKDGTAAYTHALIWWFKREKAHAAKAAEILNAWSATLKSIGNHDAKLLVGMGGINYCNAAELLKHSWGKWPETEQNAFRKMLRRILHPVIEDFYPTANGNWDASMIQTMMAMGIHLDDRSMFQKAVDYFLEGKGNGAVNHYFNHFGQCQESGRDQAHTQMGLEYLVNSSEIAWKQGIDLYGAYDNRLAKGFEYTAKYNLGEDVAFEYYESYRGRYKHNKISSKSRGRLRGMYEKAYNHYHNRMGMEMPWCRKAIEKTRPERGSGSSLPWSTLMYANQPADLVKLEKGSQ